MAFTYFFFSNSGSVEVLGTEGWVKMIKFGFLPFVSWSLYFFSGLEYRAARTLVLLGHFFVLLQCQWHKLWLRDISRVAYPVSYLVFKYSTSGDFWVASGSLCQYFYIFICIHVVFYLFGIFGFWFFGFFFVGFYGAFPPVLSVWLKPSLRQFKSLAAYLICWKHKEQNISFSLHQAFTNCRLSSSDIWRLLSLDQQS